MEHSGTALIDPYKIFSKINLSPGMRVADLGCGRTGHFVFSASRQVGERGIVYAVDIMKDILENIKSRVRSEGYENIQPIWSDVESTGKTSIPEKSLDACFFVNTMFLFKKKAEALKESFRLLKDGGMIVVVDWMKKLGPLGPAPELMAKPDDVIAIAKSCGLNLLEEFPAGNYHYALIFKKV